SGDKRVLRRVGDRVLYRGRECEPRAHGVEVLLVEQRGLLGGRSTQLVSLEQLREAELFGTGPTAIEFPGQQGASAAFGEARQRGERAPATVVTGQRVLHPAGRGGGERRDEF